MKKPPQTVGGHVQHGGDIRRREQQVVTNAWQLAPAKDKADPGGKALANKLTEVATRLETAHYQDRWRSLVYYRNFYGRPSASQWAYGMAKRPVGWINYYAGFEFQAPTYNLTASCADVYVNRLFRNKTFVEVDPERGSAAQVQAAKGATEWVDAQFEDLKFWDLLVRCGLDSMTFGSGLLKWSPAFGGKKLSVSLVHKDELLLDNPEDPNPNRCIQRIWGKRDELLQTYRKDKAACEAILRAPSAQAAFFFGPGLLDTSNIVPLLEAWSLKDEAIDQPGRRALVVGDYALVDEEYDDPELPFEKLDFHVVSSSFYGQGLAEVMCNVNSQLNEKLGDMSEIFRRLAWPRWLVEENSGVNDAALGDSPGVIVKWSGTRPELVVGQTVNQEIPQHVDRLIRLGMARAHLSERATQGEIPTGIRSAVGLNKFVQIDDANFAELAGRIEYFVKRCAVRALRLGIEIKPKTNIPGGKSPLVDWDVVERAFKDSPISLKAYGINRLSQDPAARQQQIEAMLANGEISKKTYTRLAQVPNIDGELDMLNAPQDAVDKMLDAVVLDEYVPPVPFMDLQYAKVRVEQRYALEYVRGTKQADLDRLMLWRAAVIDLRTQLETPEKPALPNIPAGPPSPDMAAPAVDPNSFGAPDMPGLAPSTPQIAPALPPVGNA